MDDVVVVGSGHNALIAAAYLAKAGLKVTVFERRPQIGGAVCTHDDIFPGYRIDVGSSAHVMIHQTPILAELELARYGLEYLDMDPFAYAPVAGGGGAIRFWKDVDRTCQEIAAISPADADAYARFCQEWGDLNEGVFAAFLKPPTPLNLVRAMMGRSFAGSDRLNKLRQIFGPYGQLVTETFQDETLRTAIIWLAAQSGPPPFEAASGDFAGWHSMYHRSGMKRAKGGSGALTQALRQRIVADGGAVVGGAPVDRILVDGTGRSRGVVLADGTTHEARAVLAGCHIKTTIEQLLREAPLAGALRKRVADLRIGNGFGMIVRCAMSGLPTYPGEPVDARGVGSQHHGLQLLCPSRHALDAAYGDYLAGRPPAEPIPLVMTFSALDPTLAPEGKHVMFVWGQYHPYELRNGETWPEIAEREADKLIAAVDRYAPGTAAKVLDRYIQTPLAIEELHGMYRANVMHLEMSFDQMFLFRPTPEMSGYTVPGVNGLYLTGASMHPGGGVWGASGYIAAHLMLKQSRRWRR